MPAAILISTLPKYVSRDEHRLLAASTPASFSDIPPVLKHEEPNVSVTLDPPLEGFSAEDSANGTLYVIESVLVFLSSTGKGFQIEYPAITLHAVSRGESGPSVYCQLDENVGEEESSAPADEDSLGDMRELIIAPKNAGSLDAIFEALSVCAALHPDKRTDSDDEEMDDAFIDVNSPFETFTGDGDEELSEVGRAALAHLESIMINPHETKESPEKEEAADKTTKTSEPKK